MIIIINNIVLKNQIIKFDYFYPNLEKNLNNQYIIRFILAIIYIIAISLMLIEIIFICFIKLI
jgi:hypothetical protein